MVSVYVYDNIIHNRTLNYSMLSIQTSYESQLCFLSWIETHNNLILWCLFFSVCQYNGLSSMAAQLSDTTKQLTLLLVLSTINDCQNEERKC